METHGQQYNTTIYNISFELGHTTPLLKFKFLVLSNQFPSYCCTPAAYSLYSSSFLLNSSSLMLRSCRLITVLFQLTAVLLPLTHCTLPAYCCTPAAYCWTLPAYCCTPAAFTYTNWASCIRCTILLLHFLSFRISPFLAVRTAASPAASVFSGSGYSSSN
jgi:hypothetical protein